MKKTAHKIAEEVLEKMAQNYASLSPQMQERFLEDLENVIDIKREGAYSPLLQHSRFQEIVKGTPEQASAARKAALLSGLLSGGLGTGAMYMIGRKQWSPIGLTLGIPSAIMGYLGGRRHQRLDELKKFVEETL